MEAEAIECLVTVKKCPSKEAVRVSTIVIRERVYKLMEKGKSEWDAISLVEDEMGARIAMWQQEPLLVSGSDEDMDPESDRDARAASSDPLGGRQPPPENVGTPFPASSTNTAGRQDAPKPQNPN